MQRRPVAVTAAAMLLSGASCAPAARPSGPPPPTATPTPAPPPTPCASAAPSPSASPSPLRVVDARLELLARVPAYDAAAANGRVFALDPDVRTLRAFDLATAKELWSTPLGVAPSGRVTIHPSYGAKKRVLVHVQNQLLLFDPTTGALVSQVDGPWNQAKTRLSIEHGACAFETDCDTHLVDCDDARPYGPVLRSAVTHLYRSLHEPHDNVCFGPHAVVGRGGNVVVAVTDGLAFDVPGVAKREGPLTVGIDVATGRTLWSTRDVGCHPCADGGVSPDGATCWTAGTNGKLDVFACATGNLRFEKKLPEKALARTRPTLFATWAFRGLFLSTATDAALLDGTSGRAIWSQSLPANSLALPLATPLELGDYPSWDARTVLLLDSRSGKEVVRFELPADRLLIQSADLGLRVKGGPAFDANGRARTVAEDQPLFSLARDRAPALLFRANEKAPLAEATTDLAIVAASRGGESDALALFVWGARGATGELVLARCGRLGRSLGTKARRVLTGSRLQAPGSRPQQKDSARTTGPPHPPRSIRFPSSH